MAKEEDVPHIKISYDIITPESAEEGDFAETGWIDEDGVEIELDEYDEEEGTDLADKAAEFLLEEGADEPSSVPWSRGTWYTAHEYREDFATGEVENRSYHLYGFADAEEKEIYRLVKRGS